jgi:lipoate-protein ligase A
VRPIAGGPCEARAHLALDAALFEALDTGTGGEAIRVWESWRPAVVVGRFGRLEREVHEPACRSDGVPVVRRTSGGGAVVVGPGCLNYSLILSLDCRTELRDVGRSYDLILGWVADALGVPGLRRAGASDLALDGRKVGGSAQRRGRRALLHHGTILYAFDLSMMARYLREPERQPAYRARRQHAGFVANAPLHAAACSAALARAFVSNARTRPRVEEGMLC